MATEKEDMTPGHHECFVSKNWWRFGVTLLRASSGSELTYLLSPSHIWGCTSPKSRRLFDGCLYSDRHRSLISEFTW